MMRDPINISFVMSVCLSVYPAARVEQLGSHWTDVHGNFTFDYVLKLCRENSCFIKTRQE